ncbi:hypothetical protein ABIB82_007788 [Bradyrhizobium sp. i1.8.4]|uniref:hypothetical protein n=1 Tax=unclassified Bradyrhizobium TaxID=2631580 RepID=UPI003D1D79E0
MSGQAFDEADEEWLIWSVFKRSGHRFAERKRDQTKAGAFSSEVDTGSRKENATKQKDSSMTGSIGSDHALVQPKETTLAGARS